MESLLILCQTQVHSSDIALQKKLSKKALEVVRKHKLDLSKPEKLTVGLYNALFEACRIGNMHMVKMLLDNGASLNFLDSEGRSPLYIAISGFHNSQSNIALLLKWGANVNLHKHGRCPLLASFYSMNKETSKLLIKHGADVNNVILPSFCFVESVFALNSNLVMMASGVRFHLESFEDLVSLASEIVLAGLAPRTFYLSGRRFLVDGFTEKEISDLWCFQYLCLTLGFRVDQGSLQYAIDELHRNLQVERDPQKIFVIKDRVDKLCWTQAFLSRPLPLTYLARIAIRSHLAAPSVCRGRHLNDNIAFLPLPKVCKDFINMKQCTIQGIADYMY